jgi:crotonobetainyl-CoA:carnitine CoA-transferase CaiB-like acyl-CoA transferase
LWDAAVPAGPVNSVDEVYADPQVVHREMLQRLAHPGLSSGEVRLAGFPVKLSANPATARRHPPRLGEHTEEVLAELGYTAADIEGFVASGVARPLRNATTDSESAAKPSGGDLTW